MSGPRFEEAARLYWAALGRRDALPELPEESFDAFVELLDLGSKEEHSFELVELEPTPYAGILLTDRQKNWALEWAIGLAELEPFVLRSEPNAYFLADSHPDEQGRHRVYTLDEGIRGLVEFDDVSSALAWMAAKLESVRSGKPMSEKAEAHATTLDDRWEDAATSGFYVLETLLDLPLAEAFDAYSRGEWTVVDVKIPLFRFQRKGPWQRALALHLVHRFLTHRIVDLPRSLKSSELAAPIRALVSNLKSFEEAMATGMVPEAIDALTDHADARLAKLAKGWVARHDAWRASLGKDEAPVESESDDDFEDDDEVDKALAAVMAKVLGRGPKKAAAPASEPPPAATKVTKARSAAAKLASLVSAEESPAAAEPAPEDTPFLRSLRAALTSALDAMIDDELIELDPSRKGALLVELVEAGSNARTAAHLLKSLVDALVSSDLVEEVYATDDEVERFIRTRLERR